MCIRDSYRPAMSSAREGPTSECFVVSPIGEEGSDTRRTADTVFVQLISPIAENHELSCVRADHIRSPGLITAQVLKHLNEAALVIADLTGLNANVFYELAFRHTTGKPVIILSPRGQRLPFDLADSRAVIYDLADWTSLEAARREHDVNVAVPVIALARGLVPRKIGCRSIARDDPLADLETSLAPLLGGELGGKRDFDFAGGLSAGVLFARLSLVPEPLAVRRPRGRVVWNEKRRGLHAADFDILALNGSGEQPGQGVVDGVAENEGARDERDTEHDREGGQQEADNVPAGAGQAQAQHVRPAQQ